MVGSGVSHHSIGSGGVRPPMWREFLNDGLKACKSSTGHISIAIKRGRYLDACEWLKKAMDEEWTPHLRSAFLTPKFKSAEIHKLIYKLDSRMVLTPNFDRIYETLAATESDGTIIVKKHTDGDIVQCIKRGDRVILKAHGSIDDPNNLIFTRSEYAQAREKYSGFYKLLDALLVTHTVLMIGVGIDDPDFQLLFEDHAARVKNIQPHYLTSASKWSNDELMTLRETRNIKVLHYSSSSRHSELVRSLSQLVSEVDSMRDELVRSRDW